MAHRLPHICRRAAPVAALAVVCGLAGPGCWLFRSEPPRPALRAEKDDDAYPDDLDSLLAFAERSSREDSSIESLFQAIRAYEKAQRMLRGRSSPTPVFEVSWKLARACFLASEIEHDPTERLGLIQRGEDAAESAIRERPDRVEGYYYAAVLKGRRAEVSGLGFSAMSLANEVEKLGKRAVVLDPEFDNASPLRVLAMLYAKAPPWPTSIGDVDLALEYADRAVELADYPMNHLIRAEVLIEAGEPGAARDELKRVLAAPKHGRWAEEGERWRPYARKLLDRLESH